MCTRLYCIFIISIAIPAIGVLQSPLPLILWSANLLCTILPFPTYCYIAVQQNMRNLLFVYNVFTIVRKSVNDIVMGLRELQELYAGVVKGNAYVTLENCITTVPNKQLPSVLHPLKLTVDGRVHCLPNAPNHISLLANLNPRRSKRRRSRSLGWVWHDFSLSNGAAGLEPSAW